MAYSDEGKTPPPKRLARLARRVAQDAEDKALTRPSDDAPLAETPKSHRLFMEIVALVGREPSRHLTVRGIAQKLGAEASVVAHCIALHVHLEHQRSELISVPPPRGYWIPDLDEVITRVMLEPPG